MGQIYIPNKAKAQWPPSYLPQRRGQQRPPQDQPPPRSPPPPPEAGITPKKPCWERVDTEKESHLHVPRRNGGSRARPVPHGEAPREGAETEGYGRAGDLTHPQVTCSPLADDTGSPRWGCNRPVPNGGSPSPRNVSSNTESEPSSGRRPGDERDARRSEDTHRDRSPSL